ncbi:MAG TPA: hypothetical protein VJ553_03725 [Candidatus Paceibacterota bacterium]|nr:hypothetical protein [Candidatus Paceibacterota bacterium]
MEFLIIPLGIILACAIGVGVIVWRKLPYLRKLTPESHELGETVLHDYAPEAVDWYRGIPWRRYQHSIALELETLLRRIRSAMSVLDRMSDRLGQQVRGMGQRAAKQHEKVIAQIEQEKQERIVEPDPDAVDFDDPEQLKQEEQRLIIAIAQSPKDATLYSDLARITMRLGNYSDAVEAMEQAMKLEPGNEAYLKRLERAKRKLEDSKHRSPIAVAK